MDQALLLWETGCRSRLRGCGCRFRSVSPLNPSPAISLEGVAAPCCTARLFLESTNTHQAGRLTSLRAKGPRPVYARGEFLLRTGSVDGLMRIPCTEVATMLDLITRSQPVQHSRARPILLAFAARPASKLTIEHSIKM